MRFFQVAPLILLGALCGCEDTGRSASRSPEGANPPAGYAYFAVKDPQQSAGFLDVADLDGDGRQEIILSTLVELTLPGPPNPTSRGALRVFRSGADLAGPWNEEVVLATTDPNGFPFINTPQVMDVDGDGVLDIVVQTGFLLTAGGAHFWLKGPGFSERNYFSLAETTKFTSKLFFWHESAQGDLDGDGLNDIVTTSAKTQSASNPLGSPDGNEQTKVEWYRNRGDGSFDYYVITTGVGGVFIKLFDVDADGDLDIVLSQFFGPPQEPSLIWLENQAAPAQDNGFAGVWAAHVIDHTIGLGYHFEFADINGDGRTDLVAGNHNNDGDPRFQDAAGNVTVPSGVYWFEIPEDPRQSQQWLRHTIAEGMPVTLSYSNPASQGVPGIFSVGDIDADGLLDVAVPGDGNSFLYAFRQRADGSFAEDIVDTGKMFGMAKIADVDGDGQNEIVAAEHESPDGGTELPPGKLAIYRFVTATEQ